MNRLQAKTALVTGGGSGIGLAVARGLLREGARVAIAGRDAKKLAEAARQLDGGDRLLHHAADVSDPDQVQQLVRAVVERFGSIDLLVNNAGLNLRERAVRELTPALWQKLLRTNLDGTFYCIQAVLPQMLQRRDGVIVNINSTSGKRATPLGGAGYVASKFGMTGLAFCLAAEEKDSGVRVSTIYPGEVNTPILEARPVPVSEEQRQRILQPEDVAAAVLFVAGLPQHVSVPELVIKPTSQLYV
jgi:NAD(P)-dependent dehydrogenase (short-subunit alcohol dehydrogenase family)